MIEIDEIMPFYLCSKFNKEFEPCLVNNKPCFDECKHVQNPLFARDQEAVKIFETFVDRFNCLVDDNGRLCVWEKEK